ncbi:hypothetical protein K438DRAFT_1976251 [Mycena galopus ATCC 62051]|nr:hypothetical protein K438DRAFT_1976251 [Mycena galopus ATCC 62051]
MSYSRAPASSLFLSVSSASTCNAQACPPSTWASTPCALARTVPYSAPLGSATPRSASACYAQACPPSICTRRSPRLGHSATLVYHSTVSRFRLHTVSRFRLQCVCCATGATPVTPARPSRARLRHSTARVPPKARAPRVNREELQRRFRLDIARWADDSALTTTVRISSEVASGIAAVLIVAEFPWSDWDVYMTGTASDEGGYTS